MGGLGGHMLSLAENPNLKFSEIKDILIKASSGHLLGSEKTDGVNIFLSFSNKENKAKSARNKSNIKAGGLDAQGLEKKFSDKPWLSEAFKEAMYSWENAIKNLHPSIRQKIFGDDAEIYYNVEVIEPKSPNVIQYDTRNLVLHGSGHAFFDKKTGTTKDIDVTENFNILKSAIDKFTESKKEYGSFKIVNDAVQMLKALDDKKPLKNALNDISNILQTSNLNYKNTIGDYVSKRLTSFFKKEFPLLTPAPINNIINKILGYSGLRIDKILDKSPQEYQQNLKLIINNPESILKNVILPLEIIIHNFAVEILKGFKSALILDNDKEVQRLRNEVSKAIEIINNSGQKEAIDILKKQLEKLKSVENIFSAAEGFVFTHNGVTYKFTGTFAPVNQILGLFKYGRGGVAPLKDLVKESSKNRIIAMMPGGFKPPHIGHYLGAKYLAELPGVDEVHIVVSINSRFDSSKSIEFTVDQSIALWKLYSKNEPKIKILKSKASSPVRDVYDSISSLNPGDTLILGLGEKDLKDERFSKAQEWSDKNNLGITVKPLMTNVGKYSNVSATQVRDLVAKNNKKKIYELLPTHLSLKEKEQAFDILIKKNNISEISAIGSGNAEGFSYMHKNKNIFKTIDRHKFIAELFLREKIKKILKEISLKEKANLLLREHVRKLILEKSNVIDTNHPSTGINILEDLLKKIIPQLEQDFKSLTTSKEQRDSFRAHVLNALSKSLTTADINKNSFNNEITENIDNDINEKINVNVDNEEELSNIDDKFIDIDSKSQQTKDAEKEHENFSIPGKNETGRNLAMISYDKLEKNILDAYNILADNEDQKIFYDYLITNLKLYFDKFESELSTEIKEPEVGNDIISK